MIVKVGLKSYDITNLIENSEYKEKVLKLLDNPKVGKRYFRVKRGDFDNKKYLMSNCLGTLFFVLGKYPDIEKMFGPKSYAFPSSDRPGFLYFRSIMKFIDRKCEKVKKNSKKKTFVIFFKKNGDFEHSGVYLGKIGSEEFIFQQRGYGVVWNVGTISQVGLKPNFFNFK